MSKILSSRNAGRPFGVMATECAMHGGPCDSGGERNVNPVVAGVWSW